MANQTLPRKKAVGRPTKYKPQYCEAILDWFDVEPYYERVVEEKKEYYSNGKERATSRKTELKPNRLPTLFRFAQHIGVDKSTLLEWAHRHPEFSSALEKTKDFQKEFLINTGMAGASNAAMTIFTAKNITDMRNDVQPQSNNLQVFFVPKEIALKHGLNLPEAERPATFSVPAADVRIIEPDETPALPPAA